MNESDDREESDVSEVTNEYERHTKLLLIVFETVTKVMFGRDDWYIRGTTYHLRKLIELIGTNDRVTLVYDTITNDKKWHLAIAPYDRRIIEYTMFGLQQHYIDRPLDRMVYDMLNEQSFSIGYSTYKIVTTKDFLVSVTPFVQSLQFTRNICERNSLRMSENEWEGYISETFKKKRDSIELLLLTLLDGIENIIKRLFSLENLKKVKLIVQEMIERELTKYESCLREEEKISSDDTNDDTKSVRKRNTNGCVSNHKKVKRRN